jgi:hypothetical protein
LDIEPLLAVKAMGHIWQRFEPSGIDLGIALLAATVGALVEAKKRILNLR